MPKRKRARGHQPPKPAKPAAQRRPPRSSLLLGVALAWAVLTCGILLLFYLLGWQLGQGALFVRFSPFAMVRALATTLLMLIVLFGVVSMLLVGHGGWRRAVGGIGAAGAVIAIGGWIWWAAPQALTQHSFNFRSPSHDGAFVIEALAVDDLGHYLREFDARLQEPPTARGGTRVLSNPPGMTMLSHALDRAFPLRLHPPGPIERYMLENNVEPAHSGPTKLSITVAVTVTILWLLSAAAGYALGRLLLAAPGALLFTLLVTFNASTLNFAPGKDAAQLLTINLMLWAWLAAWKGSAGPTTAIRPDLSSRAERSAPMSSRAQRSAAEGSRAARNPSDHQRPLPAPDPSTALRSGRDDNLRSGVAKLSRRACSPLLAALAGAVLVIGAVSGLIHIWIAVAALVATLWHAAALRQRLAPLAHHIAFAAGGAMLIVLLALAIWRWNILATLLAVTRRFNELQQTFEIDRTIHFLIGLPTFLLFLSPAVVALLVLGLRRVRWSLGLRLLICTITVMAITYATGVTYELPRLWIAFLPPLTLAAMLIAPITRARHGRAVYALAVLLLIHFAAAGFNWSLLDVRESEYRLTRPQRMFE